MNLSKKVQTIPFCTLCKEYIGSSIDSHLDTYHYEDFVQWCHLKEIPDPAESWRWADEHYREFVREVIMRDVI